MKASARSNINILDQQTSKWKERTQCVSGIEIMTRVQLRDYLWHVSAVRSVEASLPLLCCLSAENRDFAANRSSYAINTVVSVPGLGPF